MTHRTLFSLVLCWTLHNACGQTKQNFAIATTIDKGDYFYIPASALADTIEGILYQDKTLQKTNYNKRPIEFYWISTCNDGYYNLTITPEQIFFSSTHDNPNPDRLFWVINIDTTQYIKIKRGLENRPPNKFENLSKNYRGSKIVYYDKFKDSFSIPDEWTDSMLQQHDMYCQLQIKKQLKRYFSIINSYIIDTSKKVAEPVDEVKNNKPKYFSYSKEEMTDWFPVKFEPPKIVPEH